jgi:23S rRNA maturation-related 3'-5' exoribonuclease YhaM
VKIFIGATTCKIPNNYYPNDVITHDVLFKDGIEINDDILRLYYRDEIVKDEIEHVIDVVLFKIRNQIKQKIFEEIEEKLRKDEFF